MRLPYTFFIAFRYLKSRKQKGLSFNTAISIGGVALGVMTLLVVLAVMSGFRQDLQNKILGANADAVVLTADGTVDNYESLMKTLKEQPHIRAAAPFVMGQVMLSFDKSAQGVYLRGVDPSAENTVTDFEKHMKQGSLQALS
ncbi:MAG: ABC transporter permease, partial [Nitrospiraceae bacterium]|nr:ABC transporter permease [Nitrospiraceae bacterium]